MKARVRGTRALLIVIAAVAFAGWRNVTARADLEEGAAHELATWIRAEYAREQLRGVRVEDLTPAKVDSLLAGQNVTFASVKARGTPDDMVVRVEILVDGKTGGASGVRYYRMSHDMITGWRMKRETRALTYYTTF